MQSITDCRSSECGAHPLQSCSPLPFSDDNRVLRIGSQLPLDEAETHVQSNSCIKMGVIALHSGLKL